jgi:hypothetical protein
MVVVHVLVTLILTYWAAKIAAKPILAQAVKISRMIGKALNSLGLGKDIQKQIAGSKGGSVKTDPVGNWISEKAPSLSAFFGGGSTSKANPERLKQIVSEVKAKHGIVDKNAAPSEGTIPEVK